MPRNFEYQVLKTIFKDIESAVLYALKYLENGGIVLDIIDTGNGEIVCSIESNKTHFRDPTRQVPVPVNQVNTNIFYKAAGAQDPAMKKKTRRRARRHP